MAEDNDADSGILALVQQVLKRPDAKASPAVAVAADVEDKPEIPPSEPKRDIASEVLPDSTRRPEELAGIILNALRTLDGCPQHGFVVTVYGLRPWNALLTITPEAGPVKDAALWRERVQQMAIRLRQDYDIKSDEPDRIQTAEKRPIQPE